MTPLRAYTVSDDIRPELQAREYMKAELDWEGLKSGFDDFDLCLLFHR